MMVVNLFGAPGAGKSTGAAYIFSMLKMHGINAELVTEFAKDKLWEGGSTSFENQAYIFGNQSFRISRCDGKVDVVITDSPLPLSIYYNKNKQIYTKNFDKFVMDVFNYYNNINFFIKRTSPYSSTGRFQTEDESICIEKSLYTLLKKYRISYTPVDGNLWGYNTIITYIEDKL